MPCIILSINSLENITGKVYVLAGYNSLNCDNESNSDVICTYSLLQVSQPEGWSENRTT